MSLLGNMDLTQEQRTEMHSQALLASQSSDNQQMGMEDPFVILEADGSMPLDENIIAELLS